MRSLKVHISWGFSPSQGVSAHHFSIARGAGSALAVEGALQIGQQKARACEGEQTKKPTMVQWWEPGACSDGGGLSSRLAVGGSERQRGDVLALRCAWCAKPRYTCRSTQQHAGTNPHMPRKPRPTLNKSIRGVVFATTEVSLDKQETREVGTTSTVGRLASFPNRLGSNTTLLLAVKDVLAWFRITNSIGEYGYDQQINAAVHMKPSGSV